MRRPLGRSSSSSSLLIREHEHPCRFADQFVVQSHDAAVICNIIKTTVKVTESDAAIAAIAAVIN